MLKFDSKYFLPGWCKGWDIADAATFTACFMHWYSCQDENWKKNYLMSNFVVSCSLWSYSNCPCWNLTPNNFLWACSAGQDVISALKLHWNCYILAVILHDRIKIPRKNIGILTLLFLTLFRLLLQDDGIQFLIVVLFCRHDAKEMAALLL